MTQTIVVALIGVGMFGFLVYQTIKLYRTTSESSRLTIALMSLTTLAAMTHFTLAATDALPELEVSRQAAGTLVDIQLGRGSGALVETDTAYYAIRGVLAAKKGEALELRTMKTRVYRRQSVYLCSAQDCNRLSN